MREFLLLSGGRALQGDVTVSGAKNAALPLLIATVLSGAPCEIANVPDLDDIGVMLRMLRSFGANVSFARGRVQIQLRDVVSTEAPYSLVKAIRASFWVLGPLLARTGEARVALPGGDAIGARPVDLHLKGLVKLGADIRMSHGVVIASAPGGLHAGRITLDYPSVGATHHLLMTAALIPGETIIEGAAREPEIANVAAFLNSMGAQVEGAGDSVIRVHGARELGSGSAAVIGDRIEAATYLTAGAMTGGTITVRGIQAPMLSGVLEALAQAGCEFTTGDDFVRITAPEKLRAFSFETAPFPGVATDVQPLLMAALTVSEGSGQVRETVFESRFGHVAEFRRFGANIKIDGDTAFVSGVTTLSAAPVNAPDIRAAAGLLLLGLCAEGTTQLHDIHHLDRGYESLVSKFSALGANLSRVPYFEDKDVVLGC